MSRLIHPKAILFDFDGVLVESVNIKTEAFRELFRKYPKHVSRIVKYHQDHMGISRFDKFDHVYAKILNLPLSPSKKKDLGRAFSRIVFKKVAACPPVQGALPFLRKHYRKTPLFVLSATPQAELVKIMRKRGIVRYFKGIFGIPTTKREGIVRIKRRYHLKAKELLFIGDAIADWQAAKVYGVPFIGRVMTPKKSIFPRSVPQIRNLKQLEKWIF